MSARGVVELPLGGILHCPGKDGIFDGGSGAVDDELDRALTIAEIAAGIGGVGVGEYFEPSMATKPPRARVHQPYYDVLARSMEGIHSLTLSAGEREDCPYCGASVVVRRRFRT